MAKQWYALWVKPHKESSVLEQVQSEEIDGYLPMVKVNPKNPRAAKYRPYFPGYMFVHTDLDEVGANHFNWMFGTRGLVAFDGEPVVVPEHFIHQLTKKIDQIEKAGGLVFDQLEHGDRVRIKSGPFAGYEAMFDMQLPGKDRVQVLLAFLSQHQQPIQLDVGDIEKK